MGLAAAKHTALGLKAFSLILSGHANSWQHDFVMRVSGCSSPSSFVLSSTDDDGGLTTFL